MADKSEWEEKADYWGNMPPDDAQEKGSTYAGLAGVSDQPRLDAERDAMLIADLRARATELQGANDRLTDALAYYQGRLEECKVDLRKTRRQKHNLWLQLQGRGGEVVAVEGRS